MIVIILALMNAILCTLEKYIKNIKRHFSYEPCYFIRIIATFTL